MPTLRKTGGSAGTRFKATATPIPSRLGKRVSDLNLTLPIELSEPIKTMEEALWLIYGEPGIGKTSLATQFPRSMSLMFEPGAKGLAMHKRDVPNWRHLIGYVDMLVAQAAKKPFQMVVVDTVEKSHDRCFEHVCKREVMSHPNEKPYGEGWRLINSEFLNQWERLATAGYGIVFISHVQDKAFQTRSGKQYQKIVPALSASAGEHICGMVDVIGYYGYWGNDRYLTIRGSDELEAKNRLKRQFRQAKTGKRIHSIPMFSEGDADFDEEGAFANLRRAFNNLQVGDGEPEEAVTLSNIPAKRTATRTKR